MVVAFVKLTLFRERTMGDPLGLLKVIVVQGKRLVIRDFKSSDPYVVVKLGNQVSLVSIFMEPFF